MFVHQHSLRHLLQPEHYSSAAHWQAEIDRLFIPGLAVYCCRVGVTADDGDYLTLELFGRLILVRNEGGEFLACENICSHRHCMLTNAEFGNQPKLRCQYHGWEYDKEGRTAKIPEASCFRPWDRESGLNMFRLEACGDLLFVALNDDVPSLKDWLSPLKKQKRRFPRRCGK